MTIGQIILLAMVPLGALLMLAFSHLQMKLMPPSRAMPAAIATNKAGSPSDD